MSKQVQIWKPAHDQVVAYHVMGYNNKQIASLTGYSYDHVSDLLNDPRARKAITEAQKRMRGEMMSGIGDRMIGLAEVGVRGLARTVNAEFEPGTRAKAHQDSVTFGLLDRIGYGKKTEVTTHKGSIQLSAESEERLVGALEKANKVNEIELVDAEVVDVDYDSHKGNDKPNTE